MDVFVVMSHDNGGNSGTSIEAIFEDRAVAGAWIATLQAEHKTTFGGEVPFWLEEYELRTQPPPRLLYYHATLYEGESFDKIRIDEHSYWQTHDFDADNDNPCLTPLPPRNYSAFSKTAEGARQRLIDFATQPKRD